MEIDPFILFFEILCIDALIQQWYKENVLILLHRNCIGQEFAMNEERVVLAHIIRNFIITLDESRPVVETLFIILRPKDLHLTLKPRF